MILATLFHITLGALLLTTLIYSTLKWKTKAVFIVLTFFCSGLVESNIRESLGYPVQAEMPVGDYNMAWIWIREPSANDKGNITYWIVNGDKPPRSIMRPYSKEEHEKANKTRIEIAERAKNGLQGIFVSGKKGTKMSKGAKSHDGKPGNGSGGDDDNQYDYEFKTFPLPGKN